MVVPTLQLGKRGLTETFMKEVQLILNKHEQVKIKVLKSARDADLSALPGKKQRTGHVLLLTK